MYVSLSVCHDVFMTFRDKLFQLLIRRKRIYDIEASETKELNSILNIIGVNSLRLEDHHVISCISQF